MSDADATITSHSERLINRLARAFMTRDGYRRWSTLRPHRVWTNDLYAIVWSDDNYKPIDISKEPVW